MNKAHMKIPMLSLGTGARAPRADAKDIDKKGSKEKRADKEIKVQQPLHTDFGMTAGNAIPKPLSQKQRAHDAIHSEMRESMRAWVAGEKDTDKHKATMKRGNKALTAIPKIREGKY